MENANEVEKLTTADEPAEGRGPTFWHKRRARKEAAGLARMAKRVLERHATKVPNAARDDIAAQVGRVEAALAADDHDAICESMTRLDDQLDRNLASTRKSTLREYANSVGVAVLVALLLRAFVVEAYKIPTGSMIPTMEVGDHIFVNKFLYGLRIPFTMLKFFDWRKPQRGEVIVFIYPVHPDTDFIKRVIGVEGDTIEVRQDVVYVNGQPVLHHRIPGLYTYWDYDENADTWSERTCARVEEELGGAKFITIHDAHPSVDESGAYRNDFPAPGQKYVVPRDTVFVMGDNRNNSLDSRYWGPVPLENIKGKALVVWWSSGGPDGVRWGRLGHLVE